MCGPDTTVHMKKVLRCSPWATQRLDQPADRWAGSIWQLPPLIVYCCMVKIICQKVKAVWIINLKLVSSHLFSRQTDRNVKPVTVRKICHGTCSADNFKRFQRFVMNTHMICETNIYLSVWSNHIWLYAERCGEWDTRDVQAALVCQTEDWFHRQTLLLRHRGGGEVRVDWEVVFVA